MSKFQELQDKHIKLLQSYERHKESPDLLKDVKEYTEQVVNASREISDSRERNQLRANLRFWGAYIYELTGTYPNLNLLPSETVPTPPVISSGQRKWVVIALPLLILLMVFFVVRRQFLFFGAPPANLLPQDATDAVISKALTQTAAIAFGTPFPSAENPMTQIEEFFRQTVVAQTAIASGGTPTMIPQNFETATSAALTQIVISSAVPVLASGTLPTGFTPSSVYSAPECSERAITIVWRDFKWNTNLLPGTSEIQNAVANLSLLGSGEIVSQVNVVPNGESAIIKLRDSNSDQSYLLQFKHSVFTFEPMIIQFTSDCAYNHLSVTYGGHSPLIDKSTLDLDLTLVDWGPASLANASWIAKFSIKQDEGGIYMYDWGLTIIEKTFLIRGSECSSSPAIISKSNNGKYQEAVEVFYLAGPLCPKIE